jgi:hypothetical protein
MTGVALESVTYSVQDGSISMAFENPQRLCILPFYRRYLEPGKNTNHAKQFNPNDSAELQD